MTFSPRRTAATGLVVLALHLAVLWLLQAAMERHRGSSPAPDSTPRVSVRLLEPPPAIALTQPLPLDQPATATATSARPPARSQPHGNLTTNPGITVPSNPNERLAARPSKPAEPTAPALAPAPAPAASAAKALAGLPSLLDTEATRRAIRESAHAPSLAGRAAAASDEPQRTSAQERLGNEVKSAAKGDCLKGEYAGTGMGLLSLPFLALAAARRACAP